jgi:oxygen-dependent protoporphyrinogen oxidase
MNAPLRVVVVGAGISGLSAAFEIVQRSERFPWPLELICFDRAERAGGHIRSERVGGFLCESGPTGFLDNAPATLTLARRLSLETELMPAREDARTRFLYRKGALQKLPTSPGEFLRSGALSPAGKIRVLAEILVRRRPASGDESVHDFATRRIGREAAETLIDALVGGVWSGDTRQLSLKAAFPKMAEMERVHGGLFRALLARRKPADDESENRGGSAFGPGGTLTSFRSGMQTLTAALAAALGERLRLSTTVRAVSDLGLRGFRVHLDEGAPLEADAVVLATPAFVSAGLVREMDSGIATTLESIPYAGVAVVHLGFAHETLDTGPKGFGFLAPRGEKMRSLGSLWPSDIFADRAPSGLRLTTTMIGGAHDEAAVELDDTELARIALDDLRRAMGFVVAPRFKRVVRHPRAIPQYTLGHLDRVATIEHALRERTGLVMAGNGLHGISVNACIEEAGPLAERILDVLDGRATARAYSEPR